ncbi:DMT family transporter [Marinomonas rhizomae]|uniref:Threonine/homoserine efflux transporter RhtA n=1 Tax=Marinomonas rhizomae TaxID=491948 RepID=A0A366JC08_9GAMM|nr:DMT family transporter [Marinomonas rhizomae]RBP83805.1 threonine/homoserine efflux transporter RhtA [Marinomonas rhizomae]RNF73483.1 DMT family transporter [Marinomonas rhizomae]
MNNTHSSTLSIAGIGYALAAVAIWTGFILVSKAGSLAALALPDMMMVRFGTAFILFFPFIWQHRHTIFQWRMLVLGSIGGLAYALSVFNGFDHAPATHAALLLPGLMPIMIAVFAYFLANERHSNLAWFGILLSSLGIIVLLSETLLSGTSYWLGDASFILACVFWGIFTVLLRRWKFAPWQATLGIIAVTTGLFTPIYALFLPHQISQASWEMIGLQAFYQGVMATTVQMVCYGRAVHLIGATRMGSLMALVPVFASVLAVPMFGERWTLGLSIALLCILLGTLVGNIPIHFLRRKLVRKCIA